MSETMRKALNPQSEIEEKIASVLPDVPKLEGILGAYQEYVRKGMEEINRKYSIDANKFIKEIQDGKLDVLGLGKKAFEAITPEGWTVIAAGLLANLMPYFRTLIGGDFGQTLKSEIKGAVLGIDYTGSTGSGGYTRSTGGAVAGAIAGLVPYLGFVATQKQYGEPKYDANLYGKLYWSDRWGLKHPYDK